MGGRERKEQFPQVVFLRGKNAKKKKEKERKILYFVIINFQKLEK